MKIVTYIHHGKMVFVQEHLKGKHREHCLCFLCDRFHPDNDVKNCSLAKILFAIDKAHNLVTPVYECPIFIFSWRKR